MKIAALGAALALLAGTAAGARPAGSADRDPEIDALVARAEALPPEFAADILLRVAALPSVGASRRRALLDEAFVEAHAAPDPLPLAIPSFVPIESRQGATARATRAGLDRLTLGVRAAVMMSALDPDRGRELFEDVRFDREPPGCAAATVVDADAYYIAAATIARRRYPPGALDKADALLFFGYYVWRARLATELPAVARAIARFDPSRDEMLFLDGVLRVVLERAAADPRGLSAAGLETVRRMGDLADREHALWISTAPLLVSARKYFAAQLAHGRCGDDGPPGLVAASFNEMLAGHAGEDDHVPPLPAGHGPVLARARVERYWVAPDAAALLRRVIALAGPGRRPFSVAERLSAEWQASAGALLDDLDSWVSTSGEERDHYWQKQEMAARIGRLAPTIAPRSRALRIMIEGQRHAAPSPAWRSVWFVPAASMLDLARGRRPLADLIERSGEPVLEAYARLDRLGGRAGG